MVEHGFYNFLNWFDDTAWYPLGRIVGGTVRATGSESPWVILITNSRAFPAEFGDIPQMFLHEKKMVALVVISPLRAKNLEKEKKLHIR